MWNLQPLTRKFFGQFFFFIVVVGRFIQIFLLEHGPNTTDFLQGAQYFFCPDQIFYSLPGDFISAIYVLLL